ncbi:MULTISPECIES: IclR family transcriptional regulator [unclassified Sulfitobacter]|uniref:IclR family transcriptional regulator n=1 Tax=unclassified Sulfitobacter TaxID=196795 RepID=UPI0007C28733|nr:MULTISPECIES: IclR family transcriptional regulator [unclassified Sulfitobacter]KZY02700.1 IclR family transcriptional regulator [Sulfitobacter sp. HI0023]KZY26731.1 IclR family transcriptional regulator [Sulfitobacter sp. HI0040]KZZ63311.1 IclR family transcriptional regulator [Sulfitobacter sp. HI0129]
MAEQEFVTDPAEAKDRNFVTALARGLDVLRCFRSNEVALTNTDFSERTGLPKATVSRLTHTLCALDYLVADPRTGTYRLGAGVLQLGFGVLSAMDISDRAEQEMRKLRDGPNSYITVALAEAHRLDAVYVAAERSREDVALMMRIGSRLPIFRSAIGRAILVGMDEAARERIFAFAREEGPEAEAEGRAHVDAALREFEERGYCTSYGEWRGDVNGIAVPVFTLNGSRVYGLNVGGPSFHVKKRQLETVYSKLLWDAAEAISIRSGGTRKADVESKPD